MGMGWGKDYAAMASESARSHSPPLDNKATSPMHVETNGAARSPSRPPAGGSGKDYASLATGAGAGGSGSFAPGSPTRDGRTAGRMLGAAINGRMGSGGGAASRRPPGAGRYDYPGAHSKSSPSPVGRDQFGREREWRGTALNGRRAAASPPNGQVQNKSQAIA